MGRETKFFLVCLLLLSLLPACQASENHKLNNNSRSKTVNSSTFRTPTINLTITHTVKEGETVWQIARRWGLLPEDVLRDNRLKWRSSHRLKAGDKLVINFGHLCGRTFHASFYGLGFHGREMANGQLFNMYDQLTVAHKSLPFGTWLLVKNPLTKRAAYCQVRDRGPYVNGRDFDLSFGLAKQLGFQTTQLFRLEPKRKDKGVIPLVIVNVYPPKSG